MNSESVSTTNVSLLLRINDPENHDGWAEFDRKYRPHIHQYCKKRFRMQDTEIEDMTQVILLKLLKNMRTFRYDPRQSFRAWLNTVTRNAVIDRWRKKKGIKDQPLGGSTANLRLLNEPEEFGEDPANEWAEQLYKDFFDQCAPSIRNEVSEQTWRAFELSFGGLSARAIARELDLTPNAVYQAKYRVILRFREAASDLLRS